MSIKRRIALALLLLALATGAAANPRPGATVNFNNGWRFHLGDVADAQRPAFADGGWRALNLPHDWSIEGEFSDKHPATTGGGALPGGLGWYRKTFTVPAETAGKAVYVEFDGVYRNSEVWLNGQYLGKRPYGYSSFRYELTPHLKFGGEKNVLAVKVDNSQQPNSRWYSGSGIYRNVWLTTTDKVAVAHWGTFVTTPTVSAQNAGVSLKTSVRNSLDTAQQVSLTTIIYNSARREVARHTAQANIDAGKTEEMAQSFVVKNPALWSVESPVLYKAVAQVERGGKIVDRYETPFGIRSFVFDRDAGFFLNGKPLKILGVCNHHDLGSLGAAINYRALERQLEMLKEMGVNGIRTSHNPPAPELLEIADKMGFIVMDEAFDMWQRSKTKFDYHLDWDAWHKRDLEDLILRDRNHPSVFIWSTGNEIGEQWGGPSGIPVAQELYDIAKALDPTRPVTSAFNEVSENNNLIKSNAYDLLGTNYAHLKFRDLPKLFPGKTFIGTETTSALATRGSYDMPSDQIRRWPQRWDKPLEGGNADLSCSAYDNCSAPWGSTHEETWKEVKKLPYFSGMFIWTGWDYLGEPTPYPWPARSSYFGIIDLAGFPKDAYYMYQSEWTKKPVLHIYPHWNWQTGQEVDVWAYFNAEEVELFLNGKSLGVKRKQGDELHVQWRVPFAAGTLRAVSSTGGKVVLSKEIRTAGAPAKIILSPDHNVIKKDGADLSFVTVKVVDANGTVVPNAENLVKFQLSGPAFIASVDNGNPTSMEPFKANYRKAFHGLCLAIIQNNGQAGKITLKALSDGLAPAVTAIHAH